MMDNTMELNAALSDELEITQEGNVDRLTLVYVRCDEVIIEEKYHNRRIHLDPLSTRLKKVELLQPIAITAEKRLIVGERRLLSAIKAGEEFIAAVIVNSLCGQYELLLAKILENSQQPAYSDLADLADDLLPLAREAARRRRAHKKEDPEILENFSETGTALDQVAELFNLSRPTLTKIRKVVAAAREDETRFGDLIETLDAERKVDRVYNELLRRRGLVSEKQSSPGNMEGVDLRTDKKGNLKISISAERSDMISNLKTYLAGLAAASAGSCAP